MKNTHIAGVKEHQAVLNEMLIEFDKICKKHDISYVLFAGTMLGAVRHRGFIPWDDDLDVMMLRKDYEKFLEVAEDELNEDYFIQKEFSDHWPMFFSKLRKNNTACLEKYFPKDELSHQGIYIDIFPCDNAYGSEIIRKMQYLASRIVVAKSLDARGYITKSIKKKIFMLFCRVLPKNLIVEFVRGPKDSESDYVHSFFGGTSNYRKSVYKRTYFTEQIEMPFEGGVYPVCKDYDELLTILYNDYMRIPKPEERGCKRHSILVDTENSWEEYRHYRDGMKFEEFTRSIR